ncbi:MAG TPA: hypothetical protein VIF09_28330 [Polyangiaceae bacterium]
MSFIKSPRRRFEAGRSRFVLPPLFASPLARYVVYALVALVAAVYGIVRHYSITLPPMHRPVPPAPAATYDADAGELPVPEFLGAEGGAP